MSDISKPETANSTIVGKANPIHAGPELWIPEGQADDRMPMDGSVRNSGETPPGQRAFARWSHQVMFKKWSQARHE